MTEGSPESNTLKISFDFVTLEPSILYGIPFIFRLQIFKTAAEASNFKDLFPKMHIPSFTTTSETKIPPPALPWWETRAACHLLHIPC